MIALTMNDYGNGVNVMVAVGVVDGMAVGRAGVADCVGWLVTVGVEVEIMVGNGEGVLVTVGTEVAVCVGISVGREVGVDKGGNVGNVAGIAAVGVIVGAPIITCGGISGGWY